VVIFTHHPMGPPKDSQSALLIPDGFLITRIGFSDAVAHIIMQISRLHLDDQCRHFFLDQIPHWLKVACDIAK